MAALYASVISFFDDTNIFLAIRSVVSVFSLKDFFDVLLTALIISGFLFLFRKTKSTSVVTSTIIGFIVFYLVAYYFGLYTVLSIANAILGGIVVILVIVFQKELRRFVEWINISSLRKRFSKNGKSKQDIFKGIIEIVASTAFAMAKRKIGGLLVFPGNEVIDSFVSGGFELNGKVSEPLLLSIFDTSSPGHDGAIIIEEDVVEKFGVVLPLSKRDDYEKLKHLGTRHRSALGLSERVDALCVVISEERGVVSVAFRGAIEVVETKEELEDKLRSFLHVAETNVSRGRVRRAEIISLIRGHLKDFLIALGIAFILWLVISYPRMGIVQQRFDIPVVFDNVPQKATIEKTTVLTVRVWFSGKQNDFDLLNEANLKARINVASLAADHQTKYASEQITAEDITYPPTLTLININPTRIDFELVFK